MKELTAPKNTGSTVLSGAGNGLMLGSLPLLITEMYSEVVSPLNLSKTMKIAGGFVAVLGCAVGAVYGLKEARELNNYRAALRGELSDIQEKVDENTRKIEAWTEKEKARHAHKGEAAAGLER